MDKLEHYLDQVCRGVGGPRSLRQHLRQELREHLRDAAAGHLAAGLSDEEALARAIEDFGRPEQLRSELEATHGHRLMAVVVDRALEWKERTMRAKWLWTTWAYLAAAGVIAVEVLFFTFAQVACVPKLRKIQRDGWLDLNAVRHEPVLAWLDSILNGLGWVADHVTPLLLALAGMWGMFEWRVRGENKPFMRLAALGTTGLGLAVGALFVSSAMLLPFLVGVPGMAQVSVPRAVEQMATVDRAIGALEHGAAGKDWDALQAEADRAERALARLESVVEATAALAPANAKPTVDELRAQLKPTRECLLEAQNSIRAQDVKRLEAALKKYRERSGPLGNAAKSGT